MRKMLEKNREKVLKEILHSLSDKHLSEKILMLFNSMPKAFYKAKADPNKELLLVDHLLHVTKKMLDYVYMTTKRKTIRRKQYTDLVILIGLFHDFWKFDWSDPSYPRIGAVHGFESGNKLFEFIKDSNLNKFTIDSVVVSIFAHMSQNPRRFIKDLGIKCNLKGLNMLKVFDRSSYFEKVIF